MLCRMLSLLVLLVLLPAVLGRHVDHFKARRGSGAYFVRSLRASRSGGTSVFQKGPVLRMPLSPPTTITASPLANVVVECEAWGNPPPTIHWLKDGNKIVSQGSLKSTSETPETNEVVPPMLGMSLTRSKLYLDCVSSRDEASYTCVAENPYNRISSSSQLTVKEATEEVNPLCLAKKSFGMPARITMWTHNRIEFMGSDVQLFCRSEGQPQPTITWFTPDELPVDNAQKYKVLDNGDLVIHDLVFSDLGTFTCLAENSQGSDKITTFLYPARSENRK